LSLVTNLSGEGALMNVMLAFAVGGLVGDVFLHLLPHAFHPHSHHEHEHEHENHHEHGHGHELHHARVVNVGLSVIAGFMAFYCLEKFMRSGQNQHNHSHQHSHESIHFAAYLNLIADSLHNFTDGLAIAAAFHLSRTLGITTTLACFFHEVPHEIGDFAILIRSGFSRTRAVAMQLVTACAAVLGAMAGNAINGMDEFIGMILPFTAGGFIYIAMVGIVPELLQAGSKQRKVVAVGEVLAMALGVYLMAVIAYYE